MQNRIVNKSFAWVYKHPQLYNTLQIIGNLNTDAYYTPLKKTLKRIETNSVLDIGCGSGEILKYLPKTIRYTGIDSNQYFIDYAKKKYGGDIREFICREASEIDRFITAPFDTLIFSMFIHHCSNEYVISLWDSIKESITKQVIVLEPIITKPMDFCSKLYLSIEDGEYVKTTHELEELFSQMGLTIMKKTLHRQNNFVLRNALYLLKP